MLNFIRASSPILLVASLALSPAAIAQPATAPATIAGKWEGDFGAGNWIFQFSRESTGWSGKYRHLKFNGWNTLQKLSATNTSAKFSIGADVTVDFNLKMARPDAMKGTVRFGPSASPPQKALVLPLELKKTAQ